MRSVLGLIGLLGVIGLLACQQTEKPLDSGTTEITDSATTDSASVDTSNPDTGTDTGTEITIPFEECLDRFESTIDWFPQSSFQPLEGTLWFGHTHVTAEQETRWAPRPPAFRDTTIFFEPASNLLEGSELRITATRGSESLGVLTLQPPSASPAILEQGLTDEPLEAWSESAWSVQVPWFWMEENINLEIGYVEGEVLYLHQHTLTDLGAPHRFTVSRSKIVLFGDDSFDTHTYTAEQLGLDFFSVLPISELAWVDSTDWVLDEIVVRGANGPVKVSSESERLAQTSDPDRWGILKNIFTHRLNLANTGHGLSNTTFSGGNSPYSFGTTLGLGWVVDENDTYVDINNAPYSAGWTGWSAIWHGECGNVFNHEIGHSFTLAHFTEGSANNWGISDQYPNDGVHLDSHPWGYDTIHNAFRTWYRVNSEGIALQSDGTIQGKRDSMNGGEASNSKHCFPQYTPYHGWKIQNWMESTPTLSQEGNTPSVVQWNLESKQYTPVEMDYAYEVPTHVGSPVVTIVGAIGNQTTVSDANYVYPPLYWDAGNAFPLPSPTDIGLESFNGANYLAEIIDTDGQSQYALINKSSVDDNDLYLFSFNLPLDNNTSEVRLLHSPTPYPNIDLNNADLLYARTFEAPPSLPRSAIIGQRTLHTGTITLDTWCEEGFNCDTAAEELRWKDSTPLSFHHGEPTINDCAEEGSIYTFTVDVTNDLGETDTLTLHGQRIVDSTTETWSVAMNDATPWSQSPNLSQSLRLWIPFANNQHLSAGTWRTTDTVSVYAIDNEQPQLVEDIAIKIDLTIESSTLMSLNEVIESESIELADSSLYFVVTDPNIGPTSREWWGSNTYTPLNIQMLDIDTQEMTSVTVHSYKQTCNLGWGTLWTLNSGQVADPCTYQVRLEVPETGNEHLETGHTYRSLGSQPIIFEGRRWHGPNANGLVNRFVWQLEYTAP